MIHVFVYGIAKLKNVYKSLIVKYQFYIYLYNKNYNKLFMVKSYFRNYLIQILLFL